MCRFHQLWACIMIAFGFGVWVGLWLEGGVFCFGFGLVMILIGCWLLKGRKI